MTETARTLRAVSTGLGTLAAVLGVLVLGVETLVAAGVPGLSGLPGGMSPNAAGALALLGTGLVLRRSDRLRPVAVALAVAAGTAGAVTLLEWVAGVDLGIDQLLLANRIVSLPGEPPGRMGISTCIAVALFAFALSVLDRPRWTEAAQGAAVLGGGLALLAIEGYAAGVPALARVASSTAMALPAACGLFLVASSLVLARPDTGPVRILAAAGAGGVVSRRVLPLVIVVPVAIDILAGVLTRRGLIDGAFAYAFATILIVVIFSMTLLFVAARLDLADAAWRESVQRLAASSARYRSLFENMTTGFALGRMSYQGDRPVDCLFVEGNEAFEEQTGQRRADIQGRSLVEVLQYQGELEVGLIEAFGEVVRSGEPKRFEIHAGALRRRYTLSAYRPVAGHCAVLLRDVTEERRAQEAVAALNTALQLRTEELTRANVELRAQREELRLQGAELEQRNAEVERAHRLKSQFIANMSHELRTPLNSIIGFSELLLEEAAERLDGRQARYVQDVLASGRHLLDLINDILDLSKVEAGRLSLDLEDVEPAAAVAEAVGLIQPAARKKRIAVVEAVRAVRPAWADRGRLRQILLNLLSNAVKFGPEGSRVEVATEEDGGMLRFHVRDQGPGIDPGLLPSLFVAFVQGETPLVKQHEGTGLGLAICKRLVEAHGGTIEAVSSPGTGAHLTFTVPLATAVARVHPPGDERRPEPSPG